jgi:type II secretory ATPase GspE/PulE/Tfp pilus assembly ATPase PilB-like protein
LAARRAQAAHRLRIELALADEDDLHKFIRAHYGVGGDTLDGCSRQDDPESPVDAGPSDEEEQAQEASVIKLVNDLLAEAIASVRPTCTSSPTSTSCIVRYRIDGVLQRASVPPTIHRFARGDHQPPEDHGEPEHRREAHRPQDGRITFRHASSRGGGEPGAAGGGGGGSEFDLRVSVIPMLFGEGVVLRVLSKTAVAHDPRGPRHAPRVWPSAGKALIDRPTASCSSRGPRARESPPRCTRRSTAS